MSRLGLGRVKVVTSIHVAPLSEMLPESALRSALDKVTPSKLPGKFWRVVATSSLLGLLRGENGLPEVTRIHPNLLFPGGPRRVGGRVRTRKRVVFR